jgi:hypothetical protein
MFEEEFKKLIEQVNANLNNNQKVSIGLLQELSYLLDDHLADVAWSSSGCEWEDSGCSF